MESIFRRNSGIYFARLVIPVRFRRLLRKTELIATTGARDAPLAKIIGGEILAAWRRHFLELDGQSNVDVVRLSVGSPTLTGTGLMPLYEAAQQSGIGLSTLVRYASNGRLRLHVAPQSLPGFVVRLDELDREVDELGEGKVVPIPTLMPASAIATASPGAIRLSAGDAEAAGPDLLAGRPCRFVLFEMPGQPDMGFVPSGGLEVSCHTLSVSTGEVEALRQLLAFSVTPEQLAEARTSRATSAFNDKTARRTSAAVDAFMCERAKSCNPDQARRVRAACDLFAELMGDPQLRDVDRDAVRRFRDVLLPTVPANENKVRLQHGAVTIKESIAAVTGTDWPRISRAEQVKRMQWLCGMFKWLTDEQWISDDPAAGLGAQPRGRGKRDSADHLRRDLFTRDDLKKIFSASWFATGRGQLTRAGTYREFLPYYFFLPLLGLYTGARINELCQLSLSDIRQTSNGTWFVDINEESDDGEKKIKNSNSTRLIPLHSQLIEKGLIRWCERLKAEGYDRLFPELHYDPTKGHGKAATKWFSAHLSRLGWTRDGRKVFHSFRHTLSSECLNELAMSEALTSQISGHARSQSVLGTTYRKDVIPANLSEAVERLDFGLPLVSTFDVDAGIHALRDAKARMRPARAAT